MGVGVFSDDFQETGSTFIVSGEYVSESDHNEYLDGLATDNEIIVDQCEDESWNFRHSKDPLPEKGDSYWSVGQHDQRKDALDAAFEKYDIYAPSYETWSQEQYDDFNSNFIAIVKRAGTELGLGISQYSDLHTRKVTRASFDSDFCEILNDPIKNMFSVGWRSWEHDFVIGIGASESTNFGSSYSWQDLLSKPDNQYFAPEIIIYSGKSPTRFGDDYQKMITAVEEYIRLSLMKDGIECSFKTSGYTTGSYELPDAKVVEERLLQLRETVSNWYSSITIDPSMRIANASSEELSEIINVINDDKECQSSLQIEIPLYSFSDKTILWIAPHDDNTAIASSICPVDLQNHFNGLPQTKGFSIIPRNEFTSDWFKAVQERINTGGRNSNGKLRIAVSAEEFHSATKEDITFGYGDEKIDLTPARKNKMKM